jgi:hypothetical protein
MKARRSNGVCATSTLLRNTPPCSNDTNNRKAASAQFRQFEDRTFGRALEQDARPPSPSASRRGDPVLASARRTQLPAGFCPKIERLGRVLVDRFSRGLLAGTRRGRGAGPSADAWSIAEEGLSPDLPPSEFGSAAGRRPT